MATVLEVINSRVCGTGKVRGLSLQIIAEVNVIIPGVLVSFEDLDVDASGEQMFAYCQPAAKEALRRAIASRGKTLKINSAYRTVAQQHLLRTWYERGECRIPKAAKPGRSNHEDGLAIDIPVADRNRPLSDPEFVAWKNALEAEGWDWFGSGDPFHFSYQGAGRRDDMGDLGVTAFQRLWNRNNPRDLIDDDGDFGTETAKRMNKSPATGFPISRLLKLTESPMKGDDVTEVQKALNNLGFGVAITGIYEVETETAVKQLQATKGLSIDGVVGLQTRKVLGLIP
jgi:D-alanyl-D-alanine dipeptidase